MLTLDLVQMSEGTNANDEAPVFDVPVTGDMMDLITRLMRNTSMGQLLGNGASMSIQVGMQVWYPCTAGHITSCC